MRPLKNLSFLVGTLAVAAVMLVVPRMILAAPVPMDTNGVTPMAYAQKIFYFHVPTAWCAYLSVFFCAGGSIAHLMKRSRAGLAIATAAAELVVVFGLCVLVTGPLWGRMQWGRWWDWTDVRLVSTLILWMTFVAYMFVRRYGGPGSEKLASGLALFGAVDAPITYFAVFFWNKLHPQATVVRRGGMAPEMAKAFFLSLAAFTVLYFLLLAIRVRLERARQRLDDAHLAADEAGLLDV